MNKSTQKGVLSERDFNQLVFVAVPAFGYELRSFIQGRIWVGPQNSQFFCQTQLAVHCAAEGKTMSYYGCCETDFKARYYNYKQSFKTSSKRHQTELSKLV